MRLTLFIESESKRFCKETDDWQWERSQTKCGFRSPKCVFKFENIVTFGMPSYTFIYMCQTTIAFTGFPELRTLHN